MPSARKKEYRGRKEVKDPIMPVILYIHNSIINNGTVNKDVKSSEYKGNLDAIKSKLLVHVYTDMVDPESPYSLK